MKNIIRWLTPTRMSMSRPVQTEQKSGGLKSLFALSGGGNAQWSQTDYATMAKKGYMANPVVYRCVRLISQTASAIPLIVYEGAQELDAHPMLDLLIRPNRHQAGKEFIEALIGHLLVSGNGYIERANIDDEPRELYCLRPDRVKTLCDRDGWPTGYEYTPGNGKTVHAVSPSGECNVLHLSLFHPLEDQTGFAPLQAARMALDVHNSASRWNKALLDNSARPSGALVYSSASGANLNDDQFLRLKDELEEGYTGASKAGRPMLLEGGLDWKAMGYSPRDMDFIKAREGAARDIALAFGVPPMLLGIPGDNTYSNYQEANRAFTRQTLLPLVHRVLDSVTHWLSPAFSKRIRLAVDEDRVEGLAQEREAVWRRIANADFLDEQEKREAVGYSPYRLGGDA